jgi:hypothetical protein
MPRAKISSISSKKSTEVVEPLDAVPPDEAEREPGLKLPPVEDLVRVLSETYMEESEQD